MTDRTDETDSEGSLDNPGFVANPGKFLDFACCELAWDMEWDEHSSGEVVVDVGCGNPKVKMAELLVQRYPRLHRVYAIDNQRLLIRYLNLKNVYPRIEYKHVDIERRSDVTVFEDYVHHVVSIHCFHMLQNQAAAFENVFFMLRPGGTAGFLFSCRSGNAKWFLEASENLKWNKYYNGKRPVIPVTQTMRMACDEYYQKLLEDIGFKVRYCVEMNVWEPYASDQECKESLKKMSDYSFSIPDELKDEFQSYLFGIFLKHNGREEGKICHVSLYITIMAKKPLPAVAIAPKGR